MAEADRTMERKGTNYRWTERTTSLVYRYYDRISGQWKKGTWSKTIRNTERRGESESLMEERLQFGANKWRKGRGEDGEEDQMQTEQNWRHIAPDKWDAIATEPWMQRET